MVQGSRVLQIEAPAALASAGRRITIDVGAGDGRWAYESARADADSLYIALDPDATALKEYSARAARKPARGGVANVLFVVASVEQPPPELLGRADEVKVLFPWAALLRGLMLPEPAILRGIRSLGRRDTAFEMILTYDASHDFGAGLDLPSLEMAALQALAGAYAIEGLKIEGVLPLDRAEALAIPSSWGRRLLHGRERDVLRVSGRFIDRTGA